MVDCVQLEAVKNFKKMREDVGVELYGVQQELARHQMLLEQHHDQFSGSKQSNTAAQTQLTDIRQMYRSLQTNVTGERKKGKLQECCLMRH